MTRAASISLLAALMAATAAAAQASAPAPSPYAGQEPRPIKALSEAEIGDLRDGRGMGLAKAAELNGYPGPAHVLELAAALGLDEVQTAKTRDVHARMLAAARRLGAAIVEAEQHLDHMFAAHHIDADGLRAQTTAIAALQGELRAVHLTAHLQQTAVLTPEQVRRYVALRGYGGGSQTPDRHRGHAH